jgi:hypothetical protein
MARSSLPRVQVDGTADWPANLAFVRDYWESKRGERAMPSRSDLSPAEFKAQLPSILLVDVIDGGEDFRYRLVGTQLTPFFKSNATGQLMSEVIGPFGKDVLEETLKFYRAVVRRQVPVRLTGSGSIYGQDPKHFDAYLAPLSEDGSIVNMILGTFVFIWDTDHPFRPPKANGEND